MKEWSDFAGEFHSGRDTPKCPNCQKMVPRKFKGSDIQNESIYQHECGTKFRIVGKK
jgi:hypothetical protein